jgi:hypothetical protein
MRRGEVFRPIWKVFFVAVKAFQTFCDSLFREDDEVMKNKFDN